MKHHIYILKSQRDGKLYIGQTNDLQERILRHNSNTVISTKNKGPWELIFSREFKTRSEAVSLERKLKAWKNHTRIITWIIRQTRTAFTN